MICVIDTGSGNINSIMNMLNYLGFENILSSEVQDYKKSEYLILPGIGSFDNVMKSLKEKNLIDFFRDEKKF